MSDQNPTQPPEAGAAPGVHEAFGPAPSGSGSGAGHESFGSAPGPHPAAAPPPVVPPDSAGSGAPTQAAAPVAAPAPSPAVPVQAASPAVEAVAPAAPAGPAHAAEVPAPVLLTDPGQPPAGGPVAPTQAAPKGGGAWKWIVWGLVVIAVAAAAIAIILVRNSRANDAVNAITVGDCVDSTQYEPELGTIPAKPTVSCDDAKATHKVIGIVDGQSAAALDDDSVCTPWPQTTATIWLGEHDKSGKIYCLADLGR